MEEPSTPHVVILPFPAQGHIKPMFHLAQLLCQATNFKVTFVNSDHNHHRLLNSIDLPALHDRLPRLNLVSLSDGLPFDHPRNGRLAVEWLSAIWSVTKPLFRDLMISVSKKEESMRRPTCVIADGVMSFALDVAEEVGVPVISFRTDSASSTWVYFNVEKLIQEGQIPFPENEDMDRLITSIPGFESFLRRRDLPSICRFQEFQNPVFEFFVSQTIAMTRASALILNTFEELESATISRLCSLFPKIYTVGPLHALLKNSKPPPPPPPSSDSSNGTLWKQDMSCMTWLDSQPSKSVLYISFGSLFRLARDQLLEFWGVVNSGKPFLWVLRPDLVKAEDNGGSVVVGQIPTELEEGTEERGCIVDWAPQEEILAHWAIGGFLTHSGWNSVLESIYAGVSMIGWPQIADQQVNSRCVSDLWKIGVDMKDTCDRFTVEKMVRELMPDDDRRDDTIMKSTVEIAMMARDCVEQGGSSCRSLEKLIEDIRSMRPCPRDD